jgi:hypothetical protein
MTTAAGNVVTTVIPEADYCYGRGPLKIRVDWIDRADPVRYDGENWYRVQGVQLSSTGAEIGRREILVRGRRLPATPRSDPGARPT